MVGLLAEGLHQAGKQGDCTFFATSSVPYHNHLCVKNTANNDDRRVFGGAKGGGGYVGPDNKVGKPNTGGGGMGCYGYTKYDTTCMFGDGTATTVETWGSDGGSGILFIVFDKCPCKE